MSVSVVIVPDSEGTFTISIRTKKGMDYKFNIPRDRVANEVDKILQRTNEEQPTFYTIGEKL